MSEDTKLPFNSVQALCSLVDRVEGSQLELYSLIEWMKAHDYPEGVNKGEIIANAMIAYRHLEDTISRLNRSSCAHEKEAL